MIGRVSRRVPPNKRLPGKKPDLQADWQFSSAMNVPDENLFLAIMDSIAASLLATDKASLSLKAIGGSDE